jgi:hypothetical protein
MSIADRPPRRGFDVGSLIPVIGAAVPVLRAIAGERRPFFTPFIQRAFGGAATAVIRASQGLPPRPTAAAPTAAAPTPASVPFPQFPPGPIQTQPTQPGYRPDLTERRVPPLKRPPPPPKPPKPPKGGGVPPNAGRPSAWRGNAAFIVAALAAQYGIEAVRRWWKSEKLEPETDAEYKRAIEQWERAQIERRGRERQANEAAGIARVTAESTRTREAAEARARAVLRELERDRILAEPIVITAKRLPVPPPPPPPPKTYLGVTLKQWAQFGALGVPLLRKKDEMKRPKQTTLTTVNVPSVGLQPQSSVSYFGGIAPPSTPTRTKKCECPPKKKRGPKKVRDVCYAGTYTERASGLRKSKRRKVPCR